MYKFLTKAEIARRLQISDHTAGEFVKQLPAVKIGRHLRYSEQALEALLAPALTLNGEALSQRDDNRAA